MKYDAVIIGAGQAGTPLAHDLATHGWNVALVEHKIIGGTCVNTGCTPTKTLVHRAQVAHYVRNSRRWGIECSGLRIDMPAILSQKEKVIDRSRKGLTEWIQKEPNLRWIQGTASFKDSSSISVKGERIESERFFINVGCRPAVPPIQGLTDVPYLTNESLMDLDHVPEELLVVGGGYVGLELGQTYARLGSQVTVIQQGPQILPNEDEDVATALHGALEAEGIRFVLNAEVKSASRSGQRIAIKCEGFEEQIEGTHLLVATGRRPNTEELNPLAAGIELDEHGFIQVDDKLQTRANNIWALGDVKGGAAFTHISYNDYQIVYGNLIEGKDLTIKDRPVPYCVFTDPELGRIGMTERDARHKGLPIKVASIPMDDVSRARERDETAGLMKIVVDANTDKILGAAILGISGGEVVQILGTLALTDQPYTVLKGAVYIHPTVAEGLFALLDAVK